MATDDDRPKRLDDLPVPDAATCLRLARLLGLADDDAAAGPTSGGEVPRHGSGT